MNELVLISCFRANSCCLEFPGTMGSSPVGGTLLSKHG